MRKRKDRFATNASWQLSHRAHDDLAVRFEGAGLQHAHCFTEARDTSECLAVLGELGGNDSAAQRSTTIGDATACFGTRPTPYTITNSSLNLHLKAIHDHGALITCMLLFGILPFCTGKVV